MERVLTSRLVALLAAAVVGLGWMAAAARATTSDPRYDRVSSIIAGRGPTDQTHVLCYEHGEKDDPDTVYGAWGYVWLSDTTSVNIAEEPCNGLRGIVDHDAAVPLWEEALGATVLAHESYHQNLRLFAATRDNEALTECRAMRAFHATVILLGGDKALAETLWPFALAFHYRLEVRFPKYKMACRFPFYWAPV